MKKIFTLCAALIFGATAFSQSVMPGVTISPITTDGTSDITITVDVSMICSPAGKEIDPTWTSIGFHSGAMLTPGGWANGVDWNGTNAIQLTNDGNGIFSGTFNPSTYYNVTAPLLGFKFVLNAAANGATGPWDNEGKGFNADSTCTDFVVYFAELGVEETTLNFSVAPNPTEVSTNFTFAAGTEATVSLFDLSGKLVSTTTGVEKVTVATENLTSGSYIYSIASGDKVATGKLMKK